jgi:hypothetical protein
MIRVTDARQQRRRNCAKTFQPHQSHQRNPNHSRRQRAAPSRTDLNSRRPLSLSLTYISLPIHLILFPDLTQSSSAGFNGGNKGAKEERACRSVKKFNYISKSRSTILMLSYMYVNLKWFFLIHETIIMSRFGTIILPDFLLIRRL